MIPTATTHDTAANVFTLRRWIDALNRRDFTEIAAFVSDDIVDHHLPATMPAGREGVLIWCQMLGAALEMNVRIDDVVADGDRVAVRATVSGRHVADFGGLTSTNRNFSVSMMSIERFEDGRVVERWENVDTAALIEQLTG